MATKKTTTKKTGTKKNNSWETKASSPVEVTNVSLNWFSDDEDSKLLALGTITLNNCIKINVSLMEGKEGPFVSLPSHKQKDKYYSIVFVSDREVMDAINEAVIEAYEESDDENLPFA